MEKDGSGKIVIDVDDLEVPYCTGDMTAFIRRLYSG